MDTSEQFKVINFTNIDDEDFEGQYGGKTEVIKAHETKPLTKFLADHYALHLSEKILMKKNSGSFDDKKGIEILTEKILGTVSAPAPIISEQPKILAPEFEELEEVAKPAPVETSTEPTLSKPEEPKEEVKPVKRKGGRPKK